MYILYTTQSLSQLTPPFFDLQKPYSRIEWLSKKYHKEWKWMVYTGQFIISFFLNMILYSFLHLLCLFSANAKFPFNELEPFDFDFGAQCRSHVWAEKEKERMEIFKLKRLKHNTTA